MHFWSIKGIIEHSNSTHAEINGKWVPARPLYGTKSYTPFIDRIKRAWAVFMGRADAFTWPENQ